MLSQISNGALAVVFLTFFLLCIFVGFDYYDSGFIISLSAKLNDGFTIYRDFDYVRPFGTPVFWDLLLKPFYRMHQHLYLVCRFLVLMQFFIMAYNISRVIFDQDRWDFRMYVSIPFIMLLAINVFPVMPWHTIDGLFFLSFSLFYFHKKNILLSMLFVLFAATTKQSFFLLPVYLLAAAFLFRKDLKFSFSIKFFVLIFLSIGILVMYQIPEAFTFYKTVAVKKNFEILKTVGFLIYRDSFKYFFPFAASFFVTLFVKLKFKKTHTLEVFLLSVFIFSLLIPVYHWTADIFFKHSESKSHTILSTVNGLLPLCILCFLITTYRKKELFVLKNAIVIFSLLIVWSSAISWGAGNILLALPFLLPVLRSQIFFQQKRAVFGVSALILCTRMINPYLEDDVFHTEYVQLRDVPLYSGIFTSKKNASYLAESRQTTKKYKNVIFLPGFPAAALMFEKTKNRMPWEMNVEYVNYKKDLSLLHQKDLYFVVDRSSFSYTKDNFYGSTFTEMVRKNKKIIDSTSSFYIYK